MASEFVTALKSVLDRLDDLAANDGDLRGRLQALTRAFFHMTEEPGPASQPDSAPPTPAPKPVALPEPPPPPVVAPAPAPALAQPINGPPAVVRHFPPPPAEVDLPIVAERCRLKAEAARLAPVRFGLVEETAGFDRGVGPDEYELIARAKSLPDCFLWMLYDSGPAAAGPSSYHTLAGCFETAALAADLLHELTTAPSETREPFGQAAALAAEAQSALRGAVTALGHRSDADQLRLFSCLRSATVERQVYIHRFMRADDQADPAKWANVRDRIGRLREDMRAGRDRSRRQAKLLGKIRHHVGRLAAAPPADGLGDWSRIVEVTDELVRDGLPPSSLELREWLLPVVEHLPESLDLPEGFQRVLRELDHYLASRPGEAEPAAMAPLSDEVRRAADLLRGRAAVLIGGDRRPRAAEALESALGLSELVWLEGTQSSYYAFEPFVARQDVAVVLLAIRWSSHGFSEVKEFCDRFGKPLVRLPAGYSPNQVAHHVLSQTSGKLAGPAPLKE